MHARNIEYRRPEGVTVTYRRVHFPFEDHGFDRYWHSGSPFKSLFWSQLSTSFDAGEKFFIDSARALKGRIKDPSLLVEMQEFCKQEGQHTQQHLKFDRMNAAMGLDIAGCVRRFGRVLDRARRRLDPMGMLAVTVALEHFTSTFAQLHFERPDFSAGSDPNVLALWDWHAAEETEHKATCYDIYRASGGSYIQRVVTMPVAWAMILMISLINTGLLLSKDGKLFTRDTLSGVRYLFGRRGMVTGLLPAFFEFFSPRWHPWKQDNSQAIAKWTQANDGYVQNAERATLSRPAAAG